ncbi:MAG: cytochrome c oxidase accessory protein CcoG [Rhodoferax sp.]|nr:cytochrome c oxidase accessory protein CcoG [Rhodoferax sp.]
MSAKVNSAKKVIPIVAAVPDEGDTSMHMASQKIYPRSVKGFFSNWRWIMVWLTQIVFYGLPWVEWGQRQAVLFDLSVRRFYLFGLVLYPQDLIYLTGLLIIAALSLFLFTAVAGRLWCGYACPQTVYTEIFLWVEKMVEGDRSAHMRRDEAGMSSGKFWRKFAKHFIWLAFAVWTGYTFVGYFTPIKVLGQEVMALDLGSWEIFWTIFYGFATYGNAGFMRENICLHMCPYARFQSAMFDRDTLIVTYDTERGEPRGARSKKADLAQLNLGSCVDCSLCVQVCPTGIDIRNGLQYQCIGCGACVDVCDTVMDKVGYARGLIKYSTENAMANGWTQKQVTRHVFRPRVLVYFTVLTGLVLAIVGTLATRTPFKVDIDRDRGVMARVVEAGKTENVYRLQIMNATESEQRYRVTVNGLPGLIITSEDTITVKSTEARTLPIRVQAPFEAAPPGSHEIHFEIESLDTPGKLREESKFMIPR